MYAKSETEDEKLVVVLLVMPAVHVLFHGLLRWITSKIIRKKKIKIKKLKKLKKKKK